MASAQFHDEANGTLLEALDFAPNNDKGDDTRSIDVNPFLPLGIGRPMTIKLMTVYAGDYKNGLFKNKKDMIVTSRIKPPHLADEALRAVHQIYANMQEKAAVAPSAGNYGTPLIYCTQSFVDEGMMINLEFKIDNFKQEQMEAVGKMMTFLGAIPIFAAASGVLLFAGAAAQKAAPLINSLAEKKSWLSFNFDAAIQEAGRRSLRAGFHLIRNTVDDKEFEDYEVTLNGDNIPVLLKKETANAYYKGGRPYAIISINGDLNDEHIGFSPALASTMILQKFFGVRESGTISDDIKDLFSLSNDYYFNRKISTLKSNLKKLDATSDEYKKGLEKIEAYKKNFQTDIFNGAKK